MKMKKELYQSIILIKTILLEYFALEDIVRCSSSFVECLEIQASPEALPCVLVQDILSSALNWPNPGRPIPNDNWKL